jgi:hypothetical protein
MTNHAKGVRIFDKQGSQVQFNSLYSVDRQFVKMIYVNEVTPEALNALVVPLAMSPACIDRFSLSVSATNFGSDPV